jgi:hypothetical protein
MRLRCFALAALASGLFAIQGHAQGLLGPASFGFGIEGKRYEYEQGYPVHAVRQFAFPIAVMFPLGDRFTVDIGTAYATTNVIARGSDETFSGFTDTQLRGSYVFGSDRVVATMMINLPTGKETTSATEFDVISNVASNFLGFPVNSYGNGASATGGLAFAIPTGSWNFGFGASVRYNGRYQPFSDAASSGIEYKPGIEGRFRVGADHLIGSSRLQLGATFSSFTNDDFQGLSSGPGNYNPGNRIIGEASVTSPVANGSLSVYTWDYYRTAGDNSGSTASNKENILTAGLSGSWPFSAKLQFEPMAEAKFWSPDGGDGQLYGFGAAIRFLVSSRMTFAPGGRLDFGSLQTAQTGSKTYSLSSWGFSALARYNF